MPIPKKNDDSFSHLFTFTPSVWRLLEIYTAESVGTSMLVFFGCLSQIAWNGSIYPWAGAVVFSVVVATVIQIFGHISSAHLNPAITLNFLLLGHITRRQALVYVIAECIGAISGYGLLRWVTPCEVLNLSMKLSNNSLCQTLPNPSLSDAQSIVMEFMATGCLVLVNCSCADVRNAENGAANSLKFAATILALSITVGPYTGASMNPARTLGPAFWNGNFNKLWIYWFAPLVSAYFMTKFYKSIFLRKPKVDEAPENVPLKEVKLQLSTDDLKS